MAFVVWFCATEKVIFVKQTRQDTFSTIIYTLSILKTLGQATWDIWLWFVIFNK